MTGDGEADPKVEPGGGRDVQVAASLMRMALALLDRARETLPAPRLQHALDTLEARNGRDVDHASLERRLLGDEEGDAT